MWTDFGRMTRFHTGMKRSLPQVKAGPSSRTLLEEKTFREEVAGVLQYATPLLHKTEMPLLHALMPSLRSTERRLAKDPERALAYSAEIQKLVDTGSVTKLNPEETNPEREEWYIPHHMVSHNNKNRIVFNCSFQYRGQSLNKSLLPEHHSWG